MSVADKLSQSAAFKKLVHSQQEQDDSDELHSQSMEQQSDVTVELISSDEKRYSLSGRAMAGMPVLLE